MVVLRQLQVFLERLIPGFVALGAQAQHVSEHFQTLGRDALEQLVGLLAHGARGHGGPRERAGHAHPHLVCLAHGLEHPEILALARGIHHVHGVPPKARQRRVAFGHQLLRAFVAVHHLVVQRHQPVGLVRVAPGVILERAGQHLHRVSQGGLLQHSITHRRVLIAQSAQHVSPRGHVNRAVDSGPRLLVQAHLVVRQAEHALELVGGPDHAGLEHLPLESGIHARLELRQRQPTPHLQNAGFDALGGQHQLRLVVGRHAGVLGRQIVGQHWLPIHVAAPHQRALEQWARQCLVVLGADGLLGQVAPGIHARQQAGGKVGGIVRQQGHIIDEPLGRLEHRLECRGALRQMAHGAHRLVPQRHLAGVAQRLLNLVQCRRLHFLQLAAAENRLVAFGSCHVDHIRLCLYTSGLQALRSSVFPRQLEPG